jgi:hypothetical protein
MIKVNFTPKTDIEEYLNNDFNIIIFKELTEGSAHGMFEPLEFLNLLYEQFEIVKANKEEPRSIMKHLAELGLGLMGAAFLLQQLHWLIYDHLDSEPKDKQLNICDSFIEKAYERLIVRIHPPEPKPEPEPKLLQPENKYDFQKVKQHIETLTTVKEKILYLIEIKTDFLQNKSHWDVETGTPFDRKCELEIEKLKFFTELESTPAQIANLKLSDKQKPIKYVANEYALTYIFDLYAIGQQVPTNRIEGGFNAMKIKKDASKFPNYDKAPDTFYRAVKHVLRYDLNKPTDLQNISKDWLNAVSNLSTNWAKTEQYLKDIELIGELQGKIP